MTTPIATKITSAAQIHAAPQNEPMNPSTMPLRIVSPKKVHRSVLAFSVTSSSSRMRPSLRSSLRWNATVTGCTSSRPSTLAMCTNTTRRYGSTAARLSRRRKRERERRCAAGAFACRGDVSAVRLHDVLRDRQPKAGTAAAPRPIGLVEALEDALDLVAGDADAFVGDREADFAVDRARAQPHGRALPAELHGVVDEVREHLADAFGVGDDIRNGERRVDRQRHAGALSERSEAL